MGRHALARAKANPGSLVPLGSRHSQPPGIRLLGFLRFEDRALPLKLPVEGFIDVALPVGADGGQQTDFRVA